MIYFKLNWGALEAQTGREMIWSKIGDSQN